MSNNRIRILEELFKDVEIKIKKLEDSKENLQELSKLMETRTTYLNELKELRRRQYEESQRVDFEDDR